MNNFKIIFHISNVLFLILYLFPGSIIGYYLYDDIYSTPNLTKNFFVSSNHFYSYFLISYLGLYAYYETKKKTILIYLIIISILTETLHLIIPRRAFEFDDLFGNILGFAIAVISFLIFMYIKKNDKK